MKKLIVALALVLSTVLMLNAADYNSAPRIRTLEDRAALKTLVDTFSELADKKDIANQVLLFTEEGSVESLNGGQRVVLKGRKQLGDAFSAFLANFQVVYHINGQQTVDIKGDKASGVAYCQVTLIGTQNGRTMRTTMGVIYNDEYVRRNGTWLINKRFSNFTWRDSQEMGQPAQ